MGPDYSTTGPVYPQITVFIGDKSYKKGFSNTAAIDLIAIQREEHLIPETVESGSYVVILLGASEFRIDRAAPKKLSKQYYRDKKVITKALKNFDW